MLDEKKKIIYNNKIKAISTPPSHRYIIQNCSKRTESETAFWFVPHRRFNPYFCVLSEWSIKMTRAAEATDLIKKKKKKINYNSQVHKSRIDLLLVLR